MRTRAAHSWCVQTKRSGRRVQGTVARSAERCLGAGRGLDPGSHFACRSLPGRTAASAPWQISGAVAAGRPGRSADEQRSRPPRGPAWRAWKKSAGGIRTHPCEKEGCAERIAPIGTLSQNGYGEYLDLRKATVATPSGTWGECGGHQSPPTLRRLFDGKSSRRRARGPGWSCAVF